MARLIDSSPDGRLTAENLNGSEWVLPGLVPHRRTHLSPLFAFPLQFL